VCGGAEERERGDGEEERINGGTNDYLWHCKKLIRDGQ
jgi:hypothetical protein